MRKTFKKLGIIVILAIIGLTMIACGDPACSHDWAGWNQTSFGRETRNCNDCTSVESRLTKEIGETGEAGGIIFYRNASGFTVQASPAGYSPAWTAYTAYYLEAAPSNISGTQTWASNETDLIPGLSTNGNDQTDWAIGRGRLNTAIIIARGANFSPSYTTPAASACRALTTGGKNDWFLPSRNELHAMYIARAAPNNVAGLPTSDLLMSSSQRSSALAVIQSFFNDGINAGMGKNQTGHSVRAIRAF